MVCAGRPENVSRSASRDTQTRRTRYTIRRSTRTVPRMPPPMYIEFSIDAINRIKDSFAWSVCAPPYHTDPHRAARATVRNPAKRGAANVDGGHECYKPGPACMVKVMRKSKYGGTGAAGPLAPPTAPPWCNALTTGSTQGEHHAGLLSYARGHRTQPRRVGKTQLRVLCRGQKRVRPAAS